MLFRFLIAIFHWWIFGEARVKLKPTQLMMLIEEAKIRMLIPGYFFLTTNSVFECGKSYTIFFIMSAFIFNCPPAPAPTPNPKTPHTDKSPKRQTTSPLSIVRFCFWSWEKSIIIACLGSLLLDIRYKKGLSKF